MKTYQIKDYTQLGMLTKADAIKELLKIGINYFKAKRTVERWLA